jgi:hypothetical protein
MNSSERTDQNEQIQTQWRGPMSRMSTLKLDELGANFGRLRTAFTHLTTCLQRLQLQPSNFPDLPGGCLTKPRRFYILFATIGRGWRNRIVTFASDQRSVF